MCAYAVKYTQKRYGAQLFRESYGYHYEYDDNGNVTKVTDLAGNAITYAYDSNFDVTSITYPSGTYSYIYNSARQVTSTTNTLGTTTHDYTYNGSLLASDETDDYQFYFRYDQNGSPIGFEYVTSSGAAEYYYLKNLQGDITGIVDTAGNRVATYIYDAWGNHLTAPTSGVGYLNPLRYRGYVYDTESGLYYLQSRYYSPTIGRFISADAFVSTGGILGTNMFAYCMNNPVMCKDTSGNAVETIFDIITLSISICDVIMAPYDVSAWICLVGDAIDLIPFVTGVGEYAKLVRYADKASEAFSKLSKASDYGIMSYRALKKELRGTGLEAHHIVEKRLVRYMNIDANDMLSVALTKDEHQKFTNEWRKYFKYGTDYRQVKKEDIMAAAENIYADYPELIAATYTTLYG